MRGAAYVVSCSRRRRRALGFSFDGLSRRRFPPPPAELWAFLSKAAAAGGCFSFEGRPMSPAAAAAAQILVKLPKEPPNHLDEFLQLDKEFHWAPSLFSNEDTSTLLLGARDIERNTFSPVSKGLQKIFAL